VSKESSVFEAAVEKVEESRHGGFYAVARIVSADKTRRVVTFSLESPVWTEKSHPDPGTIVLLGDVRRKVSGWRAHSARFKRLEDEE